MKNSRDNIFRSTETTKNVPRNIISGFEVRKKVRLMFSRPKDSMKGKCYPFSGYKERNKVPLVYFGCKLQQDSYG